ncbi:receptor-like protein 46 [Lactuca sativa]|uniref:receptor-like protein 46 n=1 Tax=Lactuca sativa TaxID=4236 RepID=UPI000CD945E6|nr:receptor-like protein 46 [Lactuca sativa]
MATTLTTPLLMLSIVFVLNSIPTPSFSCPLHQKQALLHFKSTLTTIINSRLFIELNSWNPDSDCCTWDRVKCNTTTTITELNLSNVVPEFANPIPVFSDILIPLFHIQSLKLLDISRNSLNGEIPGDGFGNLTELVHLDMKLNNFQGSIPSQLFELESLRILDLSNNILRVVLSHEVGKLRNLERLYLNENFLSGNIPEEIGNLTKLRELYLGKNQFSGGIPSSVVYMKELESLDLSDNSFSMQIPSGMGMLPNMARLDLSKNQFTGPIPSSMQNLSKLETLRLQHNKLTGVIPTWLFNITTLRYLFIGGARNNLIWDNKANIIPRCSLKQISMTSCGISGQIPEWISSQKDLHFLDLSVNDLEGRFPDWLVEMDISGIVLSDNKLTGSIPPGLFESMKLEFLALSRNNFSEELPENIGQARSITTLMLSGNKFSGQIPMSMSNMNRLHVLDLSRNRFSGDSFPNFRENPLLYVDLSYNDFFGKIPLTFSTEILTLSLGGNKFSGDLPSNLTNLVNLECLDLYNNDITGYFQDVFPRIPTLQVLNLRNNSLEGIIPGTISNLTSLRILDLSGNKLTGSIPQGIANLERTIETPYTKHAPNDVFFSENFLEDIEYQDLIVNWKNSLQGLSSHNLDMYWFLDLSNNKISGEIPTSLGNLKSIKVLNISHNNLVGQIPVSFGNLRDIESLDLSHNKISGSIPQSLVKLDQLAILDVSNNRLTGKIPTGWQMNTMNELNFFANNSGLCGMQIMIKCPEDPSPPKGNVEEKEKQSWILWEGVWVGFPVGFFSSILIMGYFLNFLLLFKCW